MEGKQGTPESTRHLIRPTSEEVLGKAIQLAKRDCKGRDGSHDYSHVKRVMKMAEHLAKEEEEHEGIVYRMDVVRLAAVLHDVRDPKYHNEANMVDIEEFLEGAGLPVDKAQNVARVVDHVSFRKQMEDSASRRLVAVPSELSVVQDADRLDALGAVGIARAFAFGGSRGHSLRDTLDHFGEKLLKLEELMNTNAGQRIAVERTRTLRAFEKSLKHELGMVDNVNIEQ